MYYATKIIDIRNPLKTDADSIQRIDEVLERALGICNLSFTKPVAGIDFTQFMSPPINGQHYAIIDGNKIEMPHWYIDYRPRYLDTLTHAMKNTFDDFAMRIRKYAIFMTCGFDDPNALNWYLVVPKDNKLYIVMRITSCPSDIKCKYDIEIDHSIMNELSKHITAAAVMYAAPRAVMNRFKSSFFTEELTVEA